MNKVMAIAIGAVLVLLLLVFSTTYTVSFNEVAIRRTFGKSDAASVKTEPGLKWKWPIIQDKAKYDRRMQILESPLEEISTVDGQQVLVKGFLLWRIDTSNPEGTLAFDSKYGSIEAANGSLQDQFIDAMSGVMSGYRLDNLLGENNQLPDAEGRIQQRLATLGASGIEPVAVGISQLLLPERTTNSVIRRMEATRAKLAEAKRFEGNARAEGIASNAKTMADKIQTFANLRAEEIRSQANEKSADYLAQMSEEEGLATFLVWLDTLETSLSSTSTFILPTDFAPWHLMRITQETDDDGIPRAERDQVREFRAVDEDDASESGETKP